MDYLILAHQNDITAMRIYRNLVDRYSSKMVSIVSDEELIFAQIWQHQVSSKDHQTLIRLASGVILDSEKIGIVFNRLCSAPMPHFEHAKKADKEYAHMEMYALLLSWLYSLPSIVINGVLPQGLGARNYSVYKWLVIASQSGLPVRQYRFTSDSRRYFQKEAVPWQLTKDSNFQLNTKNPLKQQQLFRQAVVFLEPEPIQMSRVLVVGDSVIGEIDKQYHSACIELSKKVECNLLQLDFGLFGTQWKLMTVDAFPSVNNKIEIAAIVSFMEKNKLKACDS